ncbi:hypothetical protein Taro_038337 [Colocasia esculenta]|uniref:Uncharacterized protein n=1 Tax=Colocasia esculenta TaxID=4460 RepID=A0A843W6E0_COLES|nr:hypothetical protein [Colocasia esculenta]
MNTQIPPLPHDSSSTPFPDIQATYSSNSFSEQRNVKRRAYVQSGGPAPKDRIISHVSSDQDYFSSSSMNKTVQLVREKLDKIESSSGQPSKKSRRRI